MASSKISHKGLIKKITPETIFVGIIAQSACEACHAKGFCNVTGNEEKIIEVKNSSNNELIIGDHVIVTMEPKMGAKAVVWGYIFPFIILLATLIIMIKATDDEGISGLMAIFMMVPYFLGLFFFRRKLKSGFAFKIELTN